MTKKRRNYSPEFKGKVALEEALQHYAPPDIFNSDQGSLFTSTEFTQTLIEHNVRISMEGKGRWVDNVFTE